MRIGIVKYSTNNIGSLIGAIKKLESNLESEISIEVIERGCGVDPRSFDRLIIPGVGNFSNGVNTLLDQFGRDFFADALSSGVKILGICLGFQLLFQSSEEGGHNLGLGFFNGEIKKFPEAPTPPPNFGWRQVYSNPEEFQKFYMVHSYYAKPQEGDWISTFNGINFCAMRRAGNLWGVQFHPEISGENGLLFLADFLVND